MKLRAATALADMTRPDPAIVAEVVKLALQRADTEVAASILLLLTSDFARNAHAAVTAAAHAGQCLQVVGCCVPGLCTESDWILDRPGAAALVLAGGASLGPARDQAQPLLSFATPQGATAEWLAAAPRRWGVLSSDARGQQGGRVWAHDKLVDAGRHETAVSGALGCAGVSRGLEILSEPLPVTAIDHHDLLRLGPHPALEVLERRLPVELRDHDGVPLNLLYAAVGEPGLAPDFARANHRLIPLAAINPDEGSVVLAQPVAAGTPLFWCMRSPLAAQRDMRRTLDELDLRLGARPDFGILFSCLGRGPYYYDGVDRDLEIIRERHRGMPLIGAYGAGQIAAANGANHLLQNSVVLALYHAHV